MLEQLFEQYFHALSVADPHEAVEAVGVALDRGDPPALVMTDVLARAQRRVGEKWMSGEWTVADEHAATAVAEQALTIVSPPRPRLGKGPHVAIACAEGEWHTLPTRLAAELGRDAGMDVTVLGPSIPAEHLRRYLGDVGPDVLALSVTLSANLLGAASSLAASREMGIPVVVGGAGWGEGQRRAHALGAYARLDDLREIPARIGDLRAMDPPPLPVVTEEIRWLDDLPQYVILEAMDRHYAADRWMSTMDDRQRRETQKDLRWMARHTAAGLLCDDHSLVGDLLDWLLALLVPRGVPAAPIIDGAVHLAAAIEQDAPAGAALLRGEAAAALERVASRP